MWPFHYHIFSVHLVFLRKYNNFPICQCLCACVPVSMPIRISKTKLKRTWIGYNMFFLFFFWFLQFFSILFDSFFKWKNYLRYRNVVFCRSLLYVCMAVSLVFILHRFLCNNIILLNFFFSSFYLIWKFSSIEHRELNANMGINENHVDVLWNILKTALRLQFK